MSIQCKQRADYQGKDWWKWSVWLEGPADELDGIDYVEYTLHPTFPNPVRRKHNRHAKFRLDASGWGAFTIYVRIRYRDGREEELTHWLALQYPDASSSATRAERSAPTRGPAPPKQSTVFLTSGSADAPFAEALRGALEARGMKVMTTNDISSDVPVDSMMKMVADEADMAVAVVSDRPSSWVEREVEGLQRHKVKPIPVIVGSPSKVPPTLEGASGIHVSQTSDLEAAANEAAEQIIKVRPS